MHDPLEQEFTEVGDNKPSSGKHHELNKRPYYHRNAGESVYGKTN